MRYRLLMPWIVTGRGPEAIAPNRAWPAAL
jgi:hypothetical protein